jgi:hypothetical protein
MIRFGWSRLVLNILKDDGEMGGIPKDNPNSTLRQSASGAVDIYL